jgi:hypothetical protein
MKTNTRFPRLRTLMAALAAVAPLVAGCASSNKYAAPGGYQPSGYQPSATTDSMLVLVEIRDRSAIQGDLEEAAVLRSDVEARQERAKTMQARAAVLIKIKEAEIKTLAAQAELAKADGNEDLKADFEGRKKFAELEKKLLDRREDLRQEEVDLARAEADYFKSSERSYERELDLADLRSRRGAFAGGTVSPELLAKFGQLEAEIRESEDNVLKAAVQAAQKRKKVAEQEIALGKARQKVFAMQLKLLQSVGAAK